MCLHGQLQFSAIHTLLEVVKRRSVLVTLSLFPLTITLLSPFIEVHPTTTAIIAITPITLPISTLNLFLAINPLTNFAHLPNNALIFSTLIFSPFSQLKRGDSFYTIPPNIAKGGTMLYGFELVESSTKNTTKFSLRSLKAPTSILKKLL